MADFFKDLSFFILPLGLGLKRLEFFEMQIRKYKGVIVKNTKNTKATHVIIEDSISEQKEKCLAGFQSQGFTLSKEIKYLTTKWLSKCIAEKSLGDTETFEINWIKTEICYLEAKDKDKISVKEKPEKPEKPEVSLNKLRKLDPEKFICAQSSSTYKQEVSSTNRIIKEELQKLADAYRISNDTWRAYGYEKAIRAINNYPSDLKELSYQELCGISGISDKMARKIIEIVESGKLSKVDEICNDEKIKVLDAFCKIWGVGPTTADYWYRQGFRILDDLRTKAKLTKQQQIGLKYYDDIQKRISREEVEKIGEIVKTELKKISSSLDLDLVGSYRRGKPTCGDVDIMVVNPGPKTNAEVLKMLVDRLKAKDLLPDDLTGIEETDSDTSEDHNKYLGLFKLPGENEIRRRIDIFMAPASEYAAALMHYTGSAMFNRSIKLLAKQKGMRLTQTGLFTDVLRKGSDAVNKGQLVPTSTEKDIFRELGLEYKSPEERDH